MITAVIDEARDLMNSADDLRQLMAVDQIDRGDPPASLIKAVNEVVSSVWDSFAQHRKLLEVTKVLSLPPIFSHTD
jgi:hypothetical protein